MVDSTAILYLYIVLGRWSGIFPLENFEMNIKSGAGFYAGARLKAAYRYEFIEKCASSKPVESWRS